MVSVWSWLATPDHTIPSARLWAREPGVTKTDIHLIIGDNVTQVGKLGDRV